MHPPPLFCTGKYGNLPHTELCGGEDGTQGLGDAQFQIQLSYVPRPFQVYCLIEKGIGFRGKAADAEGPALFFSGTHLAPFPGGVASVPLRLAFCTWLSLS